MITYDQISKNLKAEMSDLCLAIEFVSNKEIILKYDAYNGNFKITYNGGLITIPRITSLEIAVNKFNEIVNKMERDLEESFLDI